MSLWQQQRLATSSLHRTSIYSRFTTLYISALGAIIDNPEDNPDVFWIVYGAIHRERLKAWRDPEEMFS
jgi:hypothetical protein